MEFQGKGVVVTGAAGVFGRWIAAAFAREGAKLCLSDNRGDALEPLARELGLDGRARSCRRRSSLTRARSWTSRPACATPGGRRTL
jgi:3-oxoacyl-[acyl-carrier protein] reductase